MNRAFTIAVFGVALFILGWVGHHVLYSNQLRANAKAMAVTHVRAKMAVERAKLLADKEGDSSKAVTELKELNDSFRSKLEAARIEAREGSSKLLIDSRRIYYYGFFSLVARTIGMFALVGSALYIFRRSLRNQIRWRERAILMMMPLAVLAMLNDTATSTTHVESMTGAGGSGVSDSYLRSVLPFDPKLRGIELPLGE